MHIDRPLSFRVRQYIPDETHFAEFRLLREPIKIAMLSCLLNMFF